MKHNQNPFAANGQTKLMTLLVAGFAASLFLSVSTVGLLLHWFAQA